MAEELINFDLPKEKSSIIKVIGVGGGGGNAVNHMCRHGIKDVNFIVCNTDAQALENSSVTVKIQLGESLTEGRGAGNKPEIGKQAAIENIEDVKEALTSNTKMVFITAGMGGGTGTGAAPVIAKAAKELGILTVAIVTIPFRNEGQRRISQALEGIAEIQQHVDSLLVINNEKIREMYGDLRVSEAFAKADDVLAVAAKGIAEIITVHGYINVDFADVETVMSNSGVAIMGRGISEGEDRALKAVQNALNSPLLNNNDIMGAKNILLNVTSGLDEITMDEIGQITDYIQDATGEEADLIWGNGMDEALGNKLSVTVIATGFGTNSIPELYAQKKKSADKVALSDSKAKKEEELLHLQVKSKADSGDEKNREASSNTVEFNISHNSSEKFVIRDKSDVEKPQQFTLFDNSQAEERLKSIKKTQTRIKEAGYNLKDEKNNIEDLENEPAYVRKRVKITDVKHSEETPLSKFTLADDEDCLARLKQDNSYLHDNVD